MSAIIASLMLASSVLMASSLLLSPCSPRLASRPQISKSTGLTIKAALADAKDSLMSSAKAENSSRSCKRISYASRLSRCLFAAPYQPASSERTGSRPVELMSYSSLNLDSIKERNGPHSTMNFAMSDEGSIWIATLIANDLSTYAFLHPFVASRPDLAKRKAAVICI